MRPRDAALLAAVLCYAAGARGFSVGRLSARGRARAARAAPSCLESTALYYQQGDVGALRVSGSLSVEPGSVLPLDNGASGLVLYQRNEFSYVFVTTDSITTAPGTSSFAVPKVELTSGLTLNWKGERIAGPDATAAPGALREAYGRLLQQNERVSPRMGLFTGLTAIDVLAPLGRGQNLLVIGPEDSTASDICVDLLAAQRGTDVGALYVAMRPADEMAAIAERAGCVTVSSTTTGEFLASVASAIALAEEARERGKHVCVVVDDMQPLRSLWELMQATERAMYAEDGTQLLAAEVGAVRDDATGSELRTFYASVLERSGVLVKAAGGGSLTLLMIARKPSMYSDAAETAAIPLEAFDPSVYPKSTLQRVRLLAKGGVQLTPAVLAQLGISSPGSHGSDGMLAARKHIDECISLADGHLLLDERLVRAAVRPPIDVRESLSRIGLGKAVSLRSTPMAAAIRQLAPRLRLELAVASDVPLGDGTSAAARRVYAWRAVLQQQLGAPRSLAKTVFALFSARAGYFDGLHAAGSLDDASAEAYRLVGLLLAAQPDIAGRIHGDYELTAADEAALGASMASVAGVAASSS